MKAGAMLPAVLGMAMLTTAANAQDYWTSFYAGISAGFGSGEASYESQNINFFQWEGGTYNNVLDGGLFGGQAGYTHQFGSFVLGVEGQLLKSNLTGNHDFTAASHDTTTAIDWLGLLTLKAGVAVEPALLYVKGGYAGASITAGQEIYAGFDART